jgi:flagellar motor switch/type III secretory pathway protein FliN
VRAGFTVLRDDGTLAVNGIVNFDASALRELTTRDAYGVPRPQPLLRSVLTRLPLILDEFDTTPTELASLTPGAVVRLDNRTLSQRAARLTVPAGQVRLVVDVSGVQATVAALISNLIEGDTMSDSPAPADAMSPGTPTSAPNVQIGAVPVRLMFSAGRVTLPYGALADIGPGYVFELDKRLDDRTITMYANDVPVAVGELVTIGDLVGVRLTRMLPKA